MIFRGRTSKTRLAMDHVSCPNIKGAVFSRALPCFRRLLAAIAIKTAGFGFMCGKFFDDFQRKNFQTMLAMNHVGWPFRSMLFSV